MKEQEVTRLLQRIRRNCEAIARIMDERAALSRYRQGHQPPRAGICYPRRTIDAAGGRKRITSPGISRV